MDKKIIFILPRESYPIQAGQVKIAYFLAKNLRDLGYKTVLISIDFKARDINNNNINTLGEAYDEIFSINISVINFIEIVINAILMRLFFKTPLQCSYLNSRKILKKIENILVLIKKDWEEDELLINFFSIRSYSLWQLSNRVGIKNVINLVDSMTLNISEKLTKLKNLKFWFWKYELNAIKSFETNLPIPKNTDAIIAVSEIDLGYFSSSNIRKTEKYLQFPVGIDFNKNKSKTIEKSFDLIFTGSLSYEPNINAVYFLVKSIMPIVWRKNKNIKLLIAGSKPSKKLKSFERINNLSLIENPKEMNNLIDKSLISIAPMFTGSGQQFKIIEAIARRVPVITTSKAAKPFKLKHQKHLLIANTADEFAECIIYIINNYENCLGMIEDAYNFIYQKYNWEKITKNYIRQILN